MEIGYVIAAGEQDPLDLVRDARRAEEAGFAYLSVTDHYHPWIREQGQSSFVWSLLGAIASATSTIRVGTGVTCPTIRIHPAVIAQAAATTARLFQGRFFFGVGTGENLNELNSVDEATLDALRRARAIARERAWAARGELTGTELPSSAVAGSTIDDLVVDIDATLVEASVSTPTTMTAGRQHRRSVECSASIRTRAPKPGS